MEMEQVQETAIRGDYLETTDEDMSSAHAEDLIDVIAVLRDTEKTGARLNYTGGTFQLTETGTEVCDYVGRQNY